MTTRSILLLLMALGLAAGVATAHAKPRGGGSHLMGRLRTVGYEVAVNNPGVDAGTTNAPRVALQSSIVHAGQSALKVDSTTLGAATAFTGFPAAALGTTIYARAYFYIEDFPAAANPSDILSIRAGTSLFFNARLNSNGTVSLRDFNNAIHGTSDPLELNRWYRIELSGKIDTGSTDACELRIDGTSVASATGLNISDTQLSNVAVGWGVNPGVNRVIYVDDLAINDSNGSDQNSWPGAGKIVLLKPISDAQVGTWTGGAGGTTNLWDAVDNTPPIGTSAETDTTQIESVDGSGDNATDEYRANMTSYQDAGIGEEDVINVVQAVLNNGEDASQGTKTGSFLILSNPAQSVADTFVFGLDLGALGVWPLNWTTEWGAPQYSPNLALATSPVFRVRKTDTGTRAASVDFIGIYVDYEDNVPVLQPIQRHMGLLSPILQE